MKNTTLKHAAARPGRETSRARLAPRRIILCNGEAARRRCALLDRVDLLKAYFNYSKMTLS